MTELSDGLIGLLLALHLAMHAMTDARRSAWLLAAQAVLFVAIASSVALARETPWPLCPALCVLAVCLIAARDRPAGDAMTHMSATGSVACAAIVMALSVLAMPARVAAAHAALGPAVALVLAALWMSVRRPDTADVAMCAMATGIALAGLDAPGIGPCLAGLGAVPAGASLAARRLV